MKLISVNIKLRENIFNKLQYSINEESIFIHIVEGIFILVPNGYVYETFGIPKHVHVKLPLLLIRAKMLDNPLTAKCFIYDVRHWRFVSDVLFI